jgi:alpha-mannosidase
MLANRGLPEYEALLAEDGTITLALTLLRCVGWLSRADIRTRRGPAGPSLATPGAQMPGRWTFHYSLIPHTGGWEEAFLEAHRLLRPLQAVRTTRGSGQAPPAASLVEIQPPEVILSSLKLAEDDGAVALRVYNISSAPARGRIRLNERHGAVQLVNLNEEPLGPADVRDGWIEVGLRPNEIVTFKLAPR